MILLRIFGFVVLALLAISCQMPTEPATSGGEISFGALAKQHKHATGSVQFVRLNDKGNMSEDKLTFAEFNAHEARTNQPASGTFYYKVLGLDSSLHRQIEVQISDVLIDPVSNKGWFVGVVISDTKGCGGNGQGGHDSDCTGGGCGGNDSGDHSDGCTGHDSGHDSGCTGDDGTDHSGGCSGSDGTDHTDGGCSGSDGTDHTGGGCSGSDGTDHTGGGCSGSDGTDHTDGGCSGSDGTDHTDGGCSGSDGTDHTDGGCSGSDGTDHTDGGCSGSDGTDHTDGGCSGSDGTDHSGGGSSQGGSHIKGKNCRLGQVLAFKVHDVATPGAAGDGITWKWFDPDDPVVLDLTTENKGSWPHLCKKTIIEGNLSLHY